MGPRLCAVSVDLDEIPNYFHIHGLEPREPLRTLVYDVALERLCSFAKSAGIPLTFFAVGRDLEREASARALAHARARGHEIANHSMDHLYDLTRRDRATIRAQIADASAIIERATGERPTGFRAPGYTITDEVFEELVALEVDYDSSVFPCPPYWAAKAAKMALIRAGGRVSKSILDTPAVLLAPRRPYRAGKPYWRRGSGVREIPVQVTRALRLPFIGTTITLAGPARARSLARMCAGEPLVNLELHGIDVLDESDGLSELAPHQPDVRVPLARKLEALGAVLETLKNAGRAFVSLREAARATT